jgi:hypothetical protein
MFNIKQSCYQRFEVNCGPWSEVIVSGTPKPDIQEKVNAFAHAAADVPTRGIASIQGQEECLHNDVKRVIIKKMSFRHQCKKIGLRGRPNPKSATRGGKNYQVYTKGQKTSGLIIQKTFIADPTN